jgi:hypothetical protein
MDSTTPTLKELIYSVWNAVRSRINISDTITEELIQFHILNVRAQLLKQDSNKGYTTDPYIIQDLGCVELELADTSECCQIPAGCKLLRTKLTIPSTIELHHQMLFTRVGPIVKTEEPFEFISYEKVPYLKYSKYTSKRICSFMKDIVGHMYFIVPDSKLKMLKWVNIQAVFEDPTKVSKFYQCPKQPSTCTECDPEIPCYTEDTPFPIKSWMIPTIVDMVVKTFIKAQASVPFDKDSDGELNLKSQAE